MAIAIKGMAELEKNIAKYSQDVVVKKAAYAVEQMAKDYKKDIENIAEFKIKDTGQYIASISTTDATQRGSVVSSSVFSDAEYAGVIEFGRSPGAKPPPMKVIAGWASRKGFLRVVGANDNMNSQENVKARGAARAIIRNKKSGGGRGGQKKEIEPRILDFLVILSIQNKIAEFGIKGKHPFKQTQMKNEPNAVSHFARYYSIKK